MTETKPICSNCKWWKVIHDPPQESERWGECLGRTPGWPQKWADDTCDDFEVKEK